MFPPALDLDHCVACRIYIYICNSIESGERTFRSNNYLGGLGGVVHAVLRSPSGTIVLRELW